MKAVIYVVECSDSVLDSVHGGGYPVVEVFVPKLKIGFNERKGMFAAGTPRADGGVDIEVPAKLAKRILQHVKERGYLEGKIVHLFKDKGSIADAAATLEQNHKNRHVPLATPNTQNG